MINVRPVVTTDLDMKLSSVHKYEEPERTREQLLNHNLDNMWTLTAYGNPIAIFGYSMAWQGSAAIWAVIGEELPKHGIRATLVLRRFLDKMSAAKGAHRVEMQVRSGEDIPLRWARTLGFEHEATLKRFGPDKHDYELMVRHY